VNLTIQLIIGIVFSGLIGFAAYRRGSLSGSGAAGAVLVGTAIFGFGGWVWGLLLIAFFVLSTLLSHYRETEKEEIAAEKFDKGNQRDLGQTLANGGAGALFALCTLIFPGSGLVAAFIGAMATVNADTWATELGVLSRDRPRLITNRQIVEPGTSGGVTRLGTMAALAGALAMGVIAVVLSGIDGVIGGLGFAALGAERWYDALWMPPVAMLGGWAGSAFDSLLGATVQVIFYSPHREKETEKKIDPNGQPNEYLRGWKWLNNDWVNFLSSLVGAGIAALAWALVTR
jgi:uncharacterized protein (TIGR00297 family)